MQQQKESADLTGNLLPYWSKIWRTVNGIGEEMAMKVYPDEDKENSECKISGHTLPYGSIDTAYLRLT
jgi:hypothetical protein